MPLNMYEPRVQLPAEPPDPDWEEERHRRAFRRRADALDIDGVDFED